MSNRNVEFTYYIDVHPFHGSGEALSPFTFTAPTSPKMDGAKRYKFTVIVPDPAEPDVDLGYLDVAEVKDEPPVEAPQ